MDIDTQISIVKAIEYNTINSNNYIYKKAIIKDKYEKIVNELRSFNFEKIAINKIQHMNFNFLMNSIINIKKVLNKNNPIMRYIKYVKPYNLKNTNNYKKNKDINNSLFYENNKLNSKNKVLLFEKEQIINFNKNKRNCKNFYYTRMCNIEYKKINNNITEKIILLQKTIRGYLSKKVVDQNINNVIAKNIITNILTIQRSFRKFLFKKKILENVIINIIQNERNIKSNKISDIFSLYHFRNLYKKHLIIKKIVISRYKSASLIQSKFLSFIVRKKVKKILITEKKSYILTYPFPAESVQIKIYLDKAYTYKIYNYFICPIRKYFIVYIDKKLIEPGEYLCHLIVDNIIKIDKRYKYINKNNIIYNLVTFGNYLIKKKRPKQIEIEIEKKNKEIERKNKESKKQKDKDKKINDELDNFYIYYYNDNENDNENNNSFNSNSSSNENGKNIFNYRNQIDEDDPDQVIDISKQIYKSKINNFFSKQNYKYIKDNNKPDLINIKDNSIKKYELEDDLKKDDNELKKVFQRFDSLDSNNDKDSLHQSECLNYNNILDELCPSVSSAVSNISMKNINSYSKKTHKTKFNNSYSSKHFSKDINKNSKTRKKNKNKSIHKKDSKIPNSSKKSHN